MSELEDFLTGVADAIREKEGSGEPIPASEYARRIRALAGDTGSYTAAEGSSLERWLSEVAEAIRAAEGSKGEIPAGEFAERIRAIETGDWITKFFDNARATLDRMGEDESFGTDEGMRELFYTALGPWLFLRVPTTELRNPLMIEAIWNEAFASICAELFDEMGINLSLEDTHPTGADSFSITYTFNGTTFTTDVSPQVPGAVVTSAILANIDAWIGEFPTKGERLEVYGLIYDYAEENFATLDQMMRDIFVY